MSLPLGNVSATLSNAMPVKTRMCCTITTSHATSFLFHVTISVRKTQTVRRDTVAKVSSVLTSVYLHCVLKEPTAWKDNVTRMFRHARCYVPKVKCVSMAGVTRMSRCVKSHAPKGKCVSVGNAPRKFVTSCVSRVTYARTANASRKTNARMLSVLLLTHA